MKQRVAQVLESQGFLVFFELRLCDVVAWRVVGGRCEIWCVEIERSSRTLLPNCRRDLPRCDRLFALAPDPRTLQAISRKLDRNFAPAQRSKVTVQLFDQFLRGNPE